MIRRILLCVCILVTVLLSADPASGVSTAKGLGYSGGSCEAVSILDVSWYRTWNVEPPDDLDGCGLEFSPTIERVQLDENDLVPESELARFRAEALRNPGACWIIGNEPEQSASPSDPWPVEEAVLAWPQIRDAILDEDSNACFVLGNVVAEMRYLADEEPFYGTDWIEDFDALYAGDIFSEINEIGVHIYGEMLVEHSEWYDGCGIIAQCISEDEMYSKFVRAVDRAVAWSETVAGGLPIRVTELGSLRGLCQYTSCEELEDPTLCYYGDVIAGRGLRYLESQPLISGYAWFASYTDSCPQDWCERCRGSLLSGDGLTPLGELYAMRYRTYMPFIKVLLP